MDNNNMKKYLPIGSVVMLKNGSKPLMVAGYPFVMTKNDKYDYMGIGFPEGMISLEYVLMFNHNDIKEVLHMGFVFKDSDKFNENLTNIAKGNIKRPDNPNEIEILDFNSNE